MTSSTRGRIGCNMIRKHIKVEPLRWYYHCDRLGMIVWQDMPNGGLIDGEMVAILSLMLGFHRNDTRWLKRFGRADESNRAEYRAELKGMIDHLYNSPASPSGCRSTRAGGSSRHARWRSG